MWFGNAEGTMHQAVAHLGKSGLRINFQIYRIAIDKLRSYFSQLTHLIHDLNYQAVLSTEVLMA